MTQDDSYQLIIKHWDELDEGELTKQTMQLCPPRNEDSGRCPGRADTTTADPWALGSAVAGKLHERQG